MKTPNTKPKKAAPKKSVKPVAHRRKSKKDVVSSFVSDFYARHGKVMTKLAYE